MTVSPARSEALSNKATVALVLAVVFFLSARTHADPDLWGHVRFGQDILSSGVPTSDSYSYLSRDHAWINHEVLAEISFGAAFHTLGVPGLVGLKVGLICFTIGLVFRRLYRQGMHVLRAGIVVVVVMILMSVGLWTIRPQLFTYLFFLLTLLLLDGADRGSTVGFWMLPVVMLVWANSHGGFLAGLGVLGIWATVSAVLRLAKQPIPPGAPGLVALVILVTASVAATLVNPYGAGLLAFLIRTGTVARPEIGEWQPISMSSPEGIAYLVVVALSIIVLVRSRRPRRPAMVAVFLATVLLPLLALRHLPLFALSFGVLMGEHLQDVWEQLSPQAAAPRPRLLAIAAFAGAAAFFGAALPQFRCIRIDPSFIRFPARAVAVMHQAGVHGNVATFFDWGEYIIWHLSPNVRVSIDGRRETVYSPESYEQSLQFLYGVGEWDAILDKAPTDMALVGRDQPTYALMRSKPGWILAYEDSLSSLFVREGSPQADALRKAVPPELPADGAGLCFP